MGGAGTRVVLAAVLSGVLHGGLLLSLNVESTVLAAEATTVEIALVGAGKAREAEAEDSPLPILRPPEPALSGAHSLQNIDTSTSGGGGSLSGATTVTWLVTEHARIRLQTAPRTVWQQAQMNRLATSRSHASLDQRRTTPNPAEASFVATGRGARQERLPTSQQEAATGTPHGGDSFQGQTERRQDFASLGSPAPAGSIPSPDTHPRAARGVQRGRGTNPVRSPVATGRPAVAQGPASTQAPLQDRQVRDRQDAELRADRPSQSWVDASEAWAQAAGNDEGGVGALGRPGVRDRPEPGGRASPRRVGPGNQGQLDTRDARYLSWYLRVRQKITRRLAFPRARALAMDQGVSVMRFVVSPAGELQGEPHVLRTSGFEDFDRAAKSAIVNAAPFPPLPAGLIADHRDHHGIRIRIEHSNPMVR